MFKVVTRSLTSLKKSTNLIQQTRKFSAAQTNSSVHNKPRVLITGGLGINIEKESKIVFVCFLMCGCFQVSFVFCCEDFDHSK